MVASLAALAGRLGVGDDDQQPAATRAVERLGAGGRWLLVFDNAGDQVRPPWR